MEFLIRIVGIIGGIFATTMLFHSTFESASEFICAYLCIGPFSNNYNHKKSSQTPTKEIVEQNLLLSGSNNLHYQNTLPPIALSEPAKINITFNENK